MKNKVVLFVSLILSSSILHAELDPLTGGATDMVKDSVTGAVKEKVTDTAKGMVKEAVTPAVPTDAAKVTEATSMEAPKTPVENAPVSTGKAVETVKDKVHKKASKKKH